jgi:hypothetical protein
LIIVNVGDKINRAVSGNPKPPHWIVKLGGSEFKPDCERRHNPIKANPNRYVKKEWMKKPDNEYLCLIYNATKTRGKVTSELPEINTINTSKGQLIPDWATLDERIFVTCSLPLSIATGFLGRGKWVSYGCHTLK